MGGRIDDELPASPDWLLLLKFRDVGARMVRVPRFLGAFRIQGGGPAVAATTNGNRDVRQLRAHLHGRQVSDDEAEKALAAGSDRTGTCTDGLRNCCSVRLSIMHL